MEVDVNWTFRGWDLINTLGLFLLGLFNHLSSRSKANKETIDGMAKDLADLNTRVGVVENDIEHLPNDDDISKLHEKINSVSDQTSEINGRLEGIDSTLTIIHQTLLDR